MFQSSMMRAVVLAAVGALAGSTCLIAAFAVDPGLVLEMDRDLPRITTSGFYPPERSGDITFSWTARSAAIRLPGLDRRQVWACAVRVRGGRGPELAQPVVSLAVDGIIVKSLAASNEYQVLEAAVPAQPTMTGLSLTITSSEAFVPGPSDKRELGVQVDQVACRPATGGLTLPPRAAIAAATMSGAVFGAAFGLLGLPLTVALCATVLLALAQALPLSAGTAPYNAYQSQAGWMAIVVAAGMTVGSFVLEQWRRRPLSAPAKFVVAFSAAALFLQLLALMHPSKPLIDAVFHAHRLEWVLGGRYFFTQTMPDGVRFPYAIGLYVMAAPWTHVTGDHVALLRIVVSVAHAVAGALLYAVAARAWNDRRIGALAVVLYQIVPLPYIVIGNANMTFAFGQAVAVMTLVAAASLPLQPRHVVQGLLLVLLASLAFLSHVGVFPVLATTLVATSVLYWWRGGPALRAPAYAVFLAASIAAFISVFSYYGQFSEAYETLDRVRGRVSGAVTAPASQNDPQPALTARGAPAAPLSRPVRLVRALSDAVRELGWPIVVLASVGLWQLCVTGVRDRLGLMLLAWGLTYAAFVLFSVITPVEPRFQRYTDEFISRVTYTTIPAVVMLAARGAVWGWSWNVVGRIGAAILVAAAIVLGVEKWTGWLA